MRTTASGTGSVFSRRIECVVADDVEQVAGKWSPRAYCSQGAWCANLMGGKMSILGWIVLGLIAGFIASKIVESRGQGFFINILLGIIGGMVGGWLFERFGETGITGFNLWSMFVAVIGAIVVLVVYHLIRRIAQD